MDPEKDKETINSNREAILQYTRESEALKALADATRPRGHITTGHTIFCGGCEDFYEECGKSIVAFRKSMKDGGWKNTKERGWLCPACCEKQEK